MDRGVQRAHNIDVPEHRTWIDHTASGARWVVECTCGYKSSTRATEREAVGTALWHIRAPERARAWEAKQARANGLTTLTRMGITAE